MRKGSANKDHTNIWIDVGTLILNKSFLGGKGKRSSDYSTYGCKIYRGLIKTFDLKVISIILIFEFFTD